MQRRLFILFFLLAFLPAAVATFVGWRTSSRQLDLLDAPGLHHALDASLDLARLTLDREKRLTQQLADSLAAADAVPNADAEPATSAALPDASWWVWPRSTDAGATESTLPLNVADLLPHLTGSSPVEPVYERRADGSCIVAVAPLTGSPRCWLVLARPPAPELVVTLDAVAQGSSGMRQLRLYYRRLLRSSTLLTLGGLAVLLMALSLWLSVVLSRRIAHPLRELVDGTQKIAGGDLDHRVDVDAPAEVGHLVTAFNSMTDDLRRSRDDLQRAERVAAWQGVARRLAHEIKNPLTPITLAMHRIRKKSDDATVLACTDTVLEEAANLERLANEFSLYAKLPQPQRETVTGAQLRETAEQLAHLYLGRTRIECVWSSWDKTCTTLVDVGQLRQVLANLVKNAVEAMNGGGTLTLELETCACENPSEKTVRLLIHDTGPGLPEDVERIFEPYTTSKATGTGLGLAIARRIVEDNGGRLRAESTPDGATFIVELPAVAPAADNA